MKRVWDDGFLLVLLLALLGVAAVLRAVGAVPPLLERTGFWWMFHATRSTAIVAAITAAFLVALAVGVDRRVVAWALVIAGTAGYVFVHPVLAITAFLAAAQLRRRTQATLPTR